MSTDDALRAEEAGEGHWATLTQVKSRFLEPWNFIFQGGGGFPSAAFQETLRFPGLLNYFIGGGNRSADDCGINREYIFTACHSNRYMREKKPCPCTTPRGMISLPMLMKTLLSG